MKFLEIHILLHHSHFYSHAYKRRDFSVIHNRNVPVISTLTPARGVTASQSIEIHKMTYFYSHAREGRDMFGVSNEPGTVEISTHTPARGVTSSRRRKPGNCTISTHTPARGVTCIWCGFGCHLENFYSHAREGRDVPGSNGGENVCVISTHTPARGVTVISYHVNLMRNISTHTPARGVTCPYRLPPEPSTNFYSHAREGRDKCHGKWNYL